MSDVVVVVGRKENGDVTRSDPRYAICDESDKRVEGAESEPRLAG